MSSWIKLTKDLSSRPEVIAMSGFLSIDCFGIVGRLSDFWGWVDTNSPDGTVKFIGAAQVDALVNTPGFAEALVKVGWLEVNESGIALPRWDRHNSMSAKARGLESEAKRLRREAESQEPPADKSPRKCRTGVGHSEDELSDQIREDKSIRERESSASAPERELSLQADAIAAMYVRADSPMETRAEILAELQRGTLPEEMRQLVARCVKAIRTAPGGAGNKFVPKALTFFAEQQWRSPEAFESRWQAEPQEGKHRNGPREVSTVHTASKIPKL